MDSFEAKRDSFIRVVNAQLATTIALILIFGALAGCSSNDDPPPPPPPPPALTLIDGIFSDSRVQGLGFRVDGVDDGTTNSDGVFQFVDGQAIEFFVGDSSNQIIIGGATLNAPDTGTLVITPRDLFEVGGDDCSDNFVGNVSRLLQTLDADIVHRNGLLIDETAIAAVTGAVNGRLEPDFCLPADEFAADPIVMAVAASLGRELVSFSVAFANFTTNFKQSRSSTIALTSDNRKLVVVNRQDDSVSIIEVKDQDGNDSNLLLAKIPTGSEPRFVAITPDDTRALVTNAVSGTLTLIDLTVEVPEAIGDPIEIGIEPRGIAITPNGKYAFIASHTTGEVVVFRMSNPGVIGVVQTGGNPHAIAITNDGDDDDRDERVFVTRFFSELIDSARPDGFDDAKQGIVDSFLVGNAVDLNAQPEQSLLLPMDSGFTADRRQFCLETRRVLKADGEVVFFNSGPDGTGAGEEALAHDTFCPDNNSTDASEDGAIAKTPQQVYANMLNAALVRGPFVYLPNVGVQPEPPVKFNTNVQGLVSTLSFAAGGGSDLSVNLNNQIKAESQPSEPTESLNRLFMNDVVAIDADKLGNQFLIVSRGGNVVIRAGVDDNEMLTINAPDDVVRFQTGNLPTGVVISTDGARAYTNNELSTSVTSIDLEANAVLERDIESSPPPEPGTQAHRRLLGKLAFFTALGIPDVLDTDDSGDFDIPLRDIVPLAHRGKASDNGWSSCASCHEDGHSDNTTWIFPTGPRQTIPLEGTFARFDLEDQRILNWNAVRGSVTDFNNNARGIQGGIGFATDVNGIDNTGSVFNHGPTEGISDALDAMTEWVATVRAPIMSDLSEDFLDVAHPGQVIFETHCASCHGGAKWTKSRTSPVYLNNPTFSEDPIGAGFFDGVLPIDIQLGVAGPQIRSFDVISISARLQFLENVATFDSGGPLELRGSGTIAGQSTQGFPALTAPGLGDENGAFNVPSLLGLGYSAPYLHDGSAATLEDVIARHRIPGDGRLLAIDFLLSGEEIGDLITFLNSIDDDSPITPSDTDAFLQR